LHNVKGTKSSRMYWRKNRGQMVVWKVKVFIIYVLEQVNVILTRLEKYMAKKNQKIEERIKEYDRLLADRN
jgi:F0F1-type ATP synthase membrane subunit b/b'